MYKHIQNITNLNPPLEGEVADTRMKCVGLTEGYHCTNSDSYRDTPLRKS